MKLYTYRDYKTTDVCEIIAEDIIEADKLYEEMCGEHPIKLNHVGCSIKVIDVIG